MWVHGIYFNRNFGQGQQRHIIPILKAAIWFQGQFCTLYKNICYVTSMSWDLTVELQSCGYGCYKWRCPCWNIKVDLWESTETAFAMPYMNTCFYKYVYVCACMCVCILMYLFPLWDKNYLDLLHYFLIFVSSKRQRGSRQRGKMYSSKLPEVSSYRLKEVCLPPFKKISGSWRVHYKTCSSLWINVVINCRSVWLYNYWEAEHLQSLLFKISYTFSLPLICS